MGRTTLTPRERDVIDAVRSGAHTYKAIARALGRGVTTHTAQAHVYSICRKIPRTKSPPLIRLILWATFGES